MHKSLSLLIALIISISAFTQQYNFINYSIEDGLAQSQVSSICQDKDGFVWIGTLGGLSKFDGVNFQNYSTKDGLLNNQINAIYRDSWDKLWFGTQGGVTVYDGTEFTNLQFKDELANNFVLSITEDRVGNIWFTTDGGGVIYYNKKEFNYINLPNGGDNNYVRHAYADIRGYVWFATRNGVSVIDKQMQVVDTLQNINATQVFVDENQDVWCTTFGDGVLKINKSGCIKYKIEQGMISNHIRAFVKRKNGAFWFVSKNGISKMFNNEIQNFRIKDGLKSENIKCINEDAYGNLFLGSDGSGLIKFTNDNFISYTESDGINSDVIMSIIEDTANNIWLSTYGQGVTLFNGEKKEYYTIKDGLGNNTVWTSMLDNQKRIWFGTSNGVSVFNGSGFKTYDMSDGLNAKKVYSLNCDKINNIWIGTKEGVAILYPEKDSIYNLGLDRNIRSILIEEDKEQAWFCSSDGLIKYNLKTKAVTKYTDIDGLPHSSVMTVLRDRKNRLWVATKNGLALFNGSKFIQVEVPDNFAANNINFLQLDKSNNLWIGTNYGLYQLNIISNKFEATDFVRYTNLDGLKSLECNQNAAFIDSRNNLWFGTSFGLMKHKLNKNNTSFSYPQVQLTDVRLFFQKQDLGKYAKGVIEETSLPKDLVLPYNKNHLTFDFIGVNHTNPDKVRYRFKLDGFDEDWQPVTKSTFVTYSNIPSGDFVFQLSASSDLKNWSSPVQFKFIVTPPFWFTWWFFVLCVVLVGTIVYYLIHRRRKIEASKRETQLIVDKSKMLSLEQQALNASMNRHFIFNSLNSIQYYINRQDKISANKYLSSFAKLVRKNLDSSLVNEIYLDDEIERINLYLKLEQMRFQDKFSYEVNIDPNIEPQSIKIPSMLLQPFIENSIWHGILPANKPGNIKVNVLKEGNKLIITVVDDGIGIDISIAQKKGKEQHHESKGMQLTKGRIDLISKVSNRDCAIKGPYQIYNSNNEVAGTEVSIVLTL